jgi:hypothetical protein
MWPSQHYYQGSAFIFTVPVTNLRPREVDTFSPGHPAPGFKTQIFLIQELMVIISIIC